MLKVSPQIILQMERQHQDIKKQIEKFENMVLPPCPNCGSEDIAVVNVGIIGRTINISAATTKFHLRANDKPGDYYCNVCKSYFSKD